MVTFQAEYARDGKEAGPSITGADTNLGDKNVGFTYEYQIDDADGDQVTVVEKLNDETLRTINNASKNETLTITITSEKLYTLGLNTVNTLTITATDGQGGTSYRRLTFKRTNSAPTISGQDSDRGKQTGSFSEAYTVNDAEGDNVVVTEFVDDKQIRSYQAKLGQQETIVLSRELWLTLANGKHQLRVEAVDGNFATSVRVWSFSKAEDKIIFQLAEPEETDDRATKIIITPTWRIEGATPKVEGLTPVRYGSGGVSCDAVDGDGTPVLFGYTCDMPRIQRFVHGLMTHGCEGVLYCFDFQEEVVRQVCGSQATIQCIDFDVVVRLLWESE